MPRYVWLSYPLAIDGPRPPAIPAPELTDLYTVARDGAACRSFAWPTTRARTSIRRATWWRAACRSPISARKS